MLLLSSLVFCFCDKSLVENIQEAGSARRSEAWRRHKAALLGFESGPTLLLKSRLTDGRSASQTPSTAKSIREALALAGDVWATCQYDQQAAVHTTTALCNAATVAVASLRLLPCSSRHTAKLLMLQPPDLHNLFRGPKARPYVAEPDTLEKCHQPPPLKP